MTLKLIAASSLSAAALVLLMAGCSSLERRFLFYPSHHPDDSGLTPWSKDGEVIGCARRVASPRNIWLMLHGNAGQASDRAYAIPSFSPEDAVFILEYPGYGSRQGVPSQEAFDRAAQ